MTPLKLQEVYDRLVGAGMVPEGQTVLPMGIVDGFNALVAKEDRTDDETRDLFEASLLLSRVNFGGKGDEAQSILMQLMASAGDFEFRPALKGPEPVEPIDKP